MTTKFFNLFCHTSLEAVLKPGSVDFAVLLSRFSIQMIGGQ